VTIPSLQLRGPAIDRSLPYADSDLIDVLALLSEGERERYAEVRDFCQTVVRPVALDHWRRGEFPFELFEGFAELGLIGSSLPCSSHLLDGLVTLELARADTSAAIFIVVHSDLFVSAIEMLGSDAQRASLLPDLLALRTTGAFALTEPDHGSDISRNMQTTATRDGDEWVISGSKRWIGNGTFADYVLVWARDTADGQIKGFLVESSRPGLSATLIDDKIAVRSVQNADIELDAVRIPFDNWLPGTRSFRDTEILLMNSRMLVAWQAVGQQFAALDVARRYANERVSFGRRIAANQLVQEQLVRMLGNATMSLSLMVQLARAQDDGTATLDQAALAKAMCTLRMRETVALGRSILGGNGISMEYEMAKIFADAEAIYTYEGSYEVNALIVGRAITGISAFG